MIQREKLIEDLRALFSENNKYLDKVILFGSVARGTHTEKSDIDLCFIGNCKSSNYLLGLKWFRLIEEKIIEMTDYISLDILAFSGDKEINKLECSSLYKEIKKDGVILFDRN